MRRQKFGGRGELEVVLLFGCPADEAFEEVRSLKPPMTEKFGVKWTNDYRIEVHFFQLSEPCAALPEKIVRVLVGRGQGRGTIVKFLLIAAAGDAYDAAKLTPAGRRNGRNSPPFVEPGDKNRGNGSQDNPIPHSRLPDSTRGRERRPACGV
jgi:hypothetical protein